MPGHAGGDDHGELAALGLVDRHEADRVGAGVEERLGHTLVGLSLGIGPADKFAQAQPGGGGEAVGQREQRLHAREVVGVAAGGVGLREPEFGNDAAHHACRVDAQRLPG